MTPGPRNLNVGNLKRNARGQNEIITDQRLLRDCHLISGAKSESHSFPDGKSPEHQTGCDEELV